MKISYKKWSLILLSWLPWSGKSSFIKKYFSSKKHYVISSDELRERYFWNHLSYSDVWIFNSLIQENWDTIFKVMKKLATSKLELWQTCIIDATLLKDKDRNFFINLWNWKEVHLIIFDLKLNTILKQNNNRLLKWERYVPSNIIINKNKSFQKFTQNKNVIVHKINEYNRDNIFVEEKIKIIEANNFDNVYVIGDTHGSPNLIKTILELNNNWQKNKFIFCWDLVDKGTKSLENMLFLYKNKNIDISYIMWNHDYKLLNNLKETINNWFIDYNKIKWYYLETLEKFINNLNKNEILNIIKFIENNFEDYIILEDYKKNKKFLISHAPFLPPIKITDINKNDCIFWSFNFRKLYQSENLNNFFIKSLYEWTKKTWYNIINWHIDYSDKLDVDNDNIINIDWSVEYNWFINIIHFSKSFKKNKIIKIPSWINI